MEKKRQIHLDILRIMATFAVVVVHVCAQNWSAAGVDTLEWFVYNLGDSMGRWAVPVFLMISGALFLDPRREVPIRKLYRGNVLRIVTAFLFWSVVYAVNRALIRPLTAEEFLTRVISGNGHMWYLIMIAGLYMTVPVLRCVTRDERATRYFLLIGFVFNVLLRTVLKTIVPLIDHAGLTKLLGLLKTNYDTMGVDVILGYSFYFLLGWYLNSYELPRKLRLTAYFCSVLGITATFVLTHGAAVKLGQKYMGFYGDLTLNVMMQSVGIFLLVRQIPWNLPQWMNRGIAAVGKWSFGVYLVHELMIGRLAGLHFSVSSFHPVIAVPLVSVGVFASSLIISALLNQIPKIGRYIV